METTPRRHLAPDALRATRAIARIARLEDARCVILAQGHPLGTIDSSIAGARTNACGALLAASYEAQDLGDSDGAIEFAVLYAEQEHLALTQRQNAERCA